MQDIQQETLNECTKTEQSALVVLWEIDLTEVGGDRYFFCNEQNEKGEPVTWQGRQYQAYPIQGSGFEMNGKGASARPTLKVSNLYGMVTGMAEDMQSLVGGTVVRRKVYARFLDAVNFVNGNSYADPEQEVISRWRIEQCSELSAVSASFVLSTPTETDGAVFPGRIMLANTCTWTYRGDECGYSGPAVADEYDQPTSDITKDKCSKCLSAGGSVAGSGYAERDLPQQRSRPTGYRPDPRRIDLPLLGSKYQAQPTEPCRRRTFRPAILLRRSGRQQMGR